ncbi:MAG: diguanylate cyclase [Deltaproteobacteria bacterium]|nr:diguanylate cyclase [Deltaproteobacteria bacterium]
MSTRVLLVAAEGAHRDADVALFGGAGMDVELAATGREASQKLADQHELVVLSRELADMDGIDLLRTLKAQDDEFTPVLMIAAGEGAPERVQMLQAGADEVVDRRVEPDELLARARALLRLKSTHDKVRAVQRDLERLVVSDPLTGLFNRRALLDRLKQEFGRYGRTKLPLALAMVDLDGFKPINDMHGHLVGDRMLRDVSEALLSSIRTIDIAARYGGDEFALVFPQTDAPGAVRVCERIIRNVGAVAVPVEHGVARVTCSVGVAFFPESGIQAPEDLLRTADDALYRAKRLGRNRLCAIRSIETVQASA